MPHMIFEGPAGTGKTSSALALSNHLFSGLSKSIIHESVKEMNASDARGIAVIRTYVKDFIKGKRNPKVPFKLLILDEADNMTSSAQQALRRQMEKYSTNCRLILICNYSNKIIPPIQSRCAVIHFKPLTAEDIKERIAFIVDKEDVCISDDAIEALAYIAYGDMRKSINTLQAASMLSEKGDYEITEDDIYSLTGTVDRREIKDLITTTIEGSLDDSLSKVEKMLEQGSSGKEIAIQMFMEAKMSTDMDVREKIIISALTSDAIYRISVGCSEVIQLRALVAGMYRKTAGV
jgi:replication factor C small subunit